jgi:hypothetical protein
LAAILAECANRLPEYGAKRTEYILLSLHVAREAINDWQANAAALESKA